MKKKIKAFNTILLIVRPSDAKKFRQQYILVCSSHHGNSWSNCL